MRGVPECGSAVSEVVGEMVLIAIVVILVSLVGISIYGLMPPGREPHADLVLWNDESSVVLHHKGGDAIPKGELYLIVDGERYSHGELRLVCPDEQELSGEGALFDLGCRIEKHDLSLEGGERVQLATPRTVLFTGVTG